MRVDGESWWELMGDVRVDEIWWELVRDGELMRDGESW